MCAEASTVLRAVAADFFFNCWYLEIPSDNRIRHISKVRPLSCARLPIGKFLSVCSLVPSLFISLSDICFSLQGVTTESSDVCGSQ
jgi:hypothetical protein